MTTAALTHHEIMGLIAPFAKAGRQVDLAACDRAARLIVFRSVDIDDPPLRETLSLDCSDTERFFLRRRLVDAEGMEATLDVAGDDPALLMASMLSVPVERHFRSGPGYRIARSYEVLSPDLLRATEVAAGVAVFMKLAHVRVQGLTLTLSLKLPGLRGVAGEIELTPTAPAAAEPSDTDADLPQDLLAVQGWDWARMIRKRGHWMSRLRLRGRALRRSRTAEAALDRVAAHLAQVLSEAPARFHERHRLARWGVVLRRSIPTLMVVFMIGGTLIAPRFVGERGMTVLMALHYVPLVLLALSFSLQELPRFEIPPLPRRARGARWRLTLGDDDEH